jgi:hypothetical protein
LQQARGNLEIGVSEEHRRISESADLSVNHDLRRSSSA